ncbi:MAG: ABC transporter ATP-binding protein [Chloroflexaceae bacterium]|nr:ABC transporter ATP-binding protein [Chloroflexaceae bacterium]NJL33141.1 ABC transporter ATP-binding protein [Chloroflexaceae bacterium]NJO04805.1 ABC transporter ATP-binding protein [Chloroflexaceae bacterium]
MAQRNENTDVQQPQRDSISVCGVEYHFNADTGVSNISFAVPAGSIFGLVGPSGSGKTTTVRLLAGVYKADKGLLVVLGQAPHRFSTHTREQIGYMQQQFVLYPNLTVQENLSFVASLYGMSYFGRGKRMKEILSFVDLYAVRHRLARQLSGGMQRRLQLACSLVHNPVLLFADEPTAGIDPVLRGKFWEYFRTLRGEGRTLFITTQYISEVAYCDLVGVMREGKLIHVDSPEGLRRKALGGEIVRIIIDEEHISDGMYLLRRQQIVQRVRPALEEPGLLLVHVEDAGAAIPQLVGILSSHPAIEIRQIEEYQPPFDDIFITLMERASQGK